MTHHRHRKGKRRRYFSGLFIGGTFALALTVFLDALLYRLTDQSFFKLLQDGSYIPAVIFLVGALQGIVYEYVGSFTFDLWYYPTVRHKHMLLLLLPLFWAMFMIIMQDTYAVLRSLGLSNNLSFILTALFPFALIEGINFYTKTWIYKGLLKSPLILAFGWVILAYTFVIGFNTYIYNLFGF
ncbi:hypothetical protein HYW36_01685 [Candidatus Saccharibacteria bacterium]|nr:hypothetical protein [Candidatus Saccharibacteria bacterium]